MDDSSAEANSWQTILSAFVVIFEAILLVVILLFVPESLKANCLTALGIAVAITAAIFIFKKNWGIFSLCIIMILVILAAILWYAFHPPQEDSPPSSISHQEPPITSSPLPSDQDLALNDSFTITEIDPTKDSMDFLTIEKAEENLLTDDSNYFPGLEMQDYRHLFLSFTEEFPDPDAVDIYEYHAYILEHSEDWSIEKLKNFINLQFQESYQSVEDCPSQHANTSSKIAENNTRLDELSDSIKQARATNELVIPLYQEYAELYLEIIDIAPRGEYYVQLARPYEEGILRMRRVEPSEKNAVFLWAANAVSCFRTALTYKDPVKASVSDIFYRIAKIYHYLGDTSGLHPNIRSYFYRVSVAYLTLAVEQESYSDTYYGYSTYYSAMVYHKLAIITTAPGAKQNYLELAEQNYQNADELYHLDSKAKDEIKHALADIDTRKRQGY